MTNSLGRGTSITHLSQFGLGEGEVLSSFTNRYKSTRAAEKRGGLVYFFIEAV